MMNVELHPLCTLFPRMTGAEFDSLCADIKANGLNSPVVVHDGMILDGGNRYRACLEIGIEPAFIEFSGGNIVSFVLSANLHRRHMSAGQQAAIVASAQDWGRAQGRGGDRRSDQSQSVDFETVEKRAAASGASRVTQMKADKLAKASPSLAKQVAHGEKSLPAALKEITPPKPVAEPAYNPVDYELEDAREAIISLATENDALKDRLAIGSVDEPEEAKATVLRTLEELRERVRCLEIENGAIKSSRDYYQSENAELKKQVAYWRKQSEKAA